MITEKLISILEGTYMEEVSLTTKEADELYSLKDQLRRMEKASILIKDPTEKHYKEQIMERLRTRIHQLRTKAFTQV